MKNKLAVADYSLEGTASLHRILLDCNVIDLYLRLPIKTKVA